MTSPSPHPVDWRLLPWQHLASTFVPASLLGLSLIVGSTGVMAVPGAAEDAPPPMDPLEAAMALPAQDGLSVVQSREGYALVWREGEAITWTEVVSCTTACDHVDDWDVDALVQALRRAKRSHPDADTFTLAPAPDVPFRAVTDTLEAARFDGEAPLFPYAVVSRR